MEQQNDLYKVNLRLLLPERRVRTAVCIPIRFGVPVPKGCLREPVRAQITGHGVGGAELQVSTTARWADGTPRWLLIEGTLQVSAHAGNEIPLVLDLKSRQSDDSLEKYCSIGHEAHNPSNALGKDGPGLINEINGIRFSLYLTTKSKKWLFPIVGSIPRRTFGSIVRTSTVNGGFGKRCGLEYTLKIEHYLPINTFLFTITLRNRNRARHRGGVWDLGDPGSVLFSEFGLELLPPSPLVKWSWSRNTCQPIEVLEIKSGARSDDSSQQCLWSLYQASSGGANWNSINHINARGHVSLPFKGYVLECQSTRDRGDRIQPVCVAETSEARVGVAVPRFWQEFPKKIAVFGERIQIGLLAGWENDYHELQGGEQKTFRIWFVRSPSVGRSTEEIMHQLEMTAGTRVILRDLFTDLPEFLAPLPDVADYAESTLWTFADTAGFGPGGLLDQREKIDEYGWRHFGDVHADHEEAYYSGSAPLISHYNNQFDLLYGCILHRLVSEDIRWDEIIVPLADHVIDIDIYHTDRDRPSFNHGLFWMTDHYKTAFTATHRSFSRLNKRHKNYGGGPCSEHNYTSGLMLVYFLWGDERAKQAVLELASWVIAMEDGRDTPFFVLDEGFTGLATMTSSSDYHGPGRGAANSINALIDAWLVSGEPEYLEFAEILIKRTIHPDDDIDSLGLLDAERRWSYTMYLESLAKYLRAKDMLDARDAMYHYAKRAFLRYAEWMVTHERPYLERAEALAYPTEAWAAQEFRKATILFLASKWTPPTKAPLFEEKARWFAETAWNYLLGFPRPHNARTAAIVLTEGLWHLALPKLAGITNELQGNEPHEIPGIREPFIGQRDRVKRKLKTLNGWLTLASRLANPAVLIRFLKTAWRWRN